MEANARAGIEFFGSVLRYAEVEQYGQRYRLLRLGSCDFDFDVTEAVWRGEPSAHLSTVSEALADVFNGSVAASYQITLHPPGGYSFFTPLPAGISDAARKLRLQQEAALLAGVDVPLRLTADAVYADFADDGERVDWVHVLAVPEPIHASLDGVLQSLPHDRHRLMTSTHAAAATVGRMLRREDLSSDPDAPFSLVVGFYAPRVEFTLCRKHHWIFSHFVDAGTGSDAVYFAVALLRRLAHDSSDVGRVFVYGNEIPPDAVSLFESVFRCAVERVNPLSLVDLDPGSLAADFGAEAYVPCMGAAL